MNLETNNVSYLETLYSLILEVICDIILKQLRQKPIKNHLLKYKRRRIT